MEIGQTEKLFYQDSHMKEFDAKVLSCEKDKKGYRVILERTAFFPEGGGQYADTGWLDEAEVWDVKEKQGTVHHITDRPLEVGKTVHGKISWEERFEKMQQHTGEHIISGLVHARFGYDNVGFHLGNDYCTMDFNGPITPEELEEIEWEANRAVALNLKVETLYPSREELSFMEYRSKIEIEGQVRIIEIPGFDVCACCAPHVKRTGEIGLIKLVGRMNYKGGERITMLCGFRALRDYRIKQANVKAIGNLLCEKENETAKAVEKLKAERDGWKNRTLLLQQKLLRYRAAETAIREGVTWIFDSGLEGNGPRELMNALLDRGTKIAAVFAGTSEEGYRYVIGSRKEDVRPFGKELNERFAGRGGGKPEMVQGSLKGKQCLIEEYLKNK